MHIFNVEGTNGTVRIVTLHPKETCSCPASGTCYHIMAAKLSIGIKEPSKQKETRSFTKLYKSVKGKGKKKSGRKRPRIGDEEVCNGDEDDNVTCLADDADADDISDYSNAGIYVYAHVCNYITIMLYVYIGRPEKQKEKI